MDMETNNFKKISLKKFIAFDFIINITGYIIAWLIPVSDACRNEIMDAIAQASILLWIMINFKKSDIRMKCLLGPLPDRKWTRNLILISVLIILLSYSALSTFNYTLWCISPSFLNSVYASSFTPLNNDSPALAIYKIIFSMSIVPLVEELIFRGFLINKLDMKYGCKKAIIFSTLLFAALHGIRFVPPLIFGYAAGLLYCKTKRLLFPIICHSINNALAGLPLILSMVLSEKSKSILYSIMDFKCHPEYKIMLFVALLSVAIYFAVKYDVENSRETDVAA